MKLNKKLVALAVAGALCALTAIPAMAFENEFHGSYTMQYFLSNYNNGGGGPFLYSPNVSGLATPSTLSGNTNENLKTNNYFEQRARLTYIAKASNDLKLVTTFEIDSVFGDKSQAGATRNSGAALESDAVNLETKNVYLEFKIPSTPTTVKAGVQGFTDSIKGIFLAGADLAGIHTSTKVGAATVNAAYFRGYDGSFGTYGAAAVSRPRGMDNLNIGALEAKFALTKDASLGAVYYVWGDGRPVAGELTGLTNDSTILHILGLTGSLKVGALDLSGFFAYQGGVIKGVNARYDSAYLNAAAYNLAAKAAVGPGTFRTALLFTSGNSQEASTGKTNHLTGWYGGQYSHGAAMNATQSATAVNAYTEAQMLLLNRSLRGFGTTDLGIAYNTGNGTNMNNGQGQYLYSLGYDANLTKNFFINSNIGFLWTAKTNALKPVDQETKMQNSTNFMGTEINTDLGYKMYDNLTIDLAVGYVMLGGYYKNALKVTRTDGTYAVTPENPYTARLGLKYVF
jgi:hypothetical protein